MAEGVASGAASGVGGGGPLPSWSCSVPLEPPAAFPSSCIRSHLTLSSEASVCDAIASPRCTLAGLQRQARVSLIHLDGSGGGGDARLGRIPGHSSLSSRLFSSKSTRAMGTGRSIPSPTNLTMHTKPIVPLSCRTCAPPRKSRLARSYSRTPAQRGRRSRFARRAPKVGSLPASAASPTSHYHQCHLGAA